MRFRSLEVNPKKFESQGYVPSTGTYFLDILVYKS